MRQKLTRAVQQGEYFLFAGTELVMAQPILDGDQVRVGVQAERTWILSGSPHESTDRITLWVGADDVVPL